MAETSSGTSITCVGNWRSQIYFDLDGGAAGMDVDPSGLRAADLYANIGAGDISIVLPETDTVRADIRG